MIAVEERLEQVIGARLYQFRFAQFVLIGVTLLCIVGAGWILWGFIGRLEKQNTQLSETENRSRLLLENARDMVLLVDVLTKEIVDVNAEACSVLGYDKKSLIEKTITLLEPNGKLEKIDARSFTSEFKEKHLVDAIFADQAGHRFPVEVNLGFLRINNRVYWLGVVRDVSGRKQMEQELVKAKQLAEAASRTKTQFLDNMSHEVRTPINGIMGTLQLLQDTELSDEQKEYVDLGMQSCDSLGSLVSNILDLSSVDSNKLRISRDSFVFEDLIWSIEEKFAHELAVKNLFCEVSLLDDIPKELVGDPKAIHQVLTGLIGNAVKFTEKGGIRVSVRRIDDGRSQKVNFARIRIEVADTGPGISEDQLKTIFKPFQQIDSSYTRKYQGAGLGLAVVEKLVKKMHGNVFVNSKVDLGSNFIVELPLEIGESCREDISSEETASNPQTMGKTALVVEQDEATRFGLEDILDRLGIQCAFAGSSDEAKELLRSESFDFALMDTANSPENKLDLPVLTFPGLKDNGRDGDRPIGEVLTPVTGDDRMMNLRERIVKMFNA